MLLSLARAALLGAAPLVAAPAAAPAQTTGVPGLSDYTVNGIGSGGTSCRSLVLAPGRAGFAVRTAAPGQVVVLAFSALPCAPASLCLAGSPCPLPATACGGTTSQSVDLGLDALILAVRVTTPSGGGGQAQLQLNLPPGLHFSTQAAVLDPACGTSLLGFAPVLLTQAYDVRT